MARNFCFLLVLQLAWLAYGSWAQRSPFSLQAAVEELHHREASKFPLNAPPSQHYYGGALGTAADQDYWEDDNAPISLFRERESQASDGSEHSELTEQFLHEIEEAQERDREQRYKDALRHLWEKYQQQDNDIDNSLYKEKRMRVPPYYMLMQKKRSYPVLPWLPYSDRKKRFPVAKRSTKRSPDEKLEKTDERVEQELSELFGEDSAEEKRKRSTEEQTKSLVTHTPETVFTAINEMRLELPSKVEPNTTEAATKTTPMAEKKDSHAHHEHGGHEHKHSKRSNHHSAERDNDGDSEEEEEEESEEHSEHGDEHEDEDEEDFGDEEDEERKKKRDVDSMKAELFRSLEAGEAAHLNRRKKSIQWSKYFGIDRKKKAKDDKKLDVDVRKRSTTEEDTDADKAKQKRALESDKLDNMDKKLQSIEDFIIDETVKYTGSHEGITNPAEIRRLKDHVLSRLATAYSLEKMRRALEKLRQSVDNENHLLHNVIETEPSSDENDSSEYTNQKRLSVKKEKANMISSAGNEKPKNSGINANNEADDSLEADKKRKKKRTSYLRYPELSNDLADFESSLGGTRYEPLNDMYLGNKNYIVGSNQCPLIESMAERCRGVDILSGDINQELLPICGVHQICYLCGTSQISCDYQYLAEADAICGNNETCQAAARSVLMILRGAPGPQLGPRECIKNSCLYSAMREIGL